VVVTEGPRLGSRRQRINFQADLHSGKRRPRRQTLFFHVVVVFLSINRKLSFCHRNNDVQWIPTSFRVILAIINHFVSAELRRQVAPVSRFVFNCPKDDSKYGKRQLLLLHFYIFFPPTLGAICRRVSEPRRARPLLFAVISVVGKTGGRRRPRRTPLTWCIPRSILPCPIYVSNCLRVSLPMFITAKRLKNRETSNERSTYKRV